MTNKVLHLITRLDQGGAQENTLYTVAHLDRRRFEPVLAAGPGGFLEREARSLRTVSSLVREVHPVQDTRALQQLIRLMKDEQPTIVHTHSSKAGILGRWAAHEAGVPLVVHTFHGFGFHARQNPFSRGVYIALERIVGRWTDGFIAVSQANLEEAVRLGLGPRLKMRLIRSGIPLGDYLSLERTRLNPPGLNLRETDRVILTVGPLKPQKNHVDLLEAAQGVVRQFPRARFVVVGEGDLRPALEREIRARSLSEHVFLMGWRRDLTSFYARAEVFAMTSLWEGLPRSLVEAMASSLPCVANAVDGVADVIRSGENGCLTRPKHPEETAQALLGYLSDPSRAQVLGRAARTSVGKEFDIDVMVRQQEQFYEDLIKYRHYDEHASPP